MSEWLALSVAAAFGCTTAAIQPRETAGHIVMAPEVESFRVCRTVDPLWIDGDPAILDALRVGYQALARSSYEEIYAVLEGSLGPQLDCGFCEHFAGSFRVGRIVLQRRPAANDCQ